MKKLLSLVLALVLVLGVMTSCQFPFIGGTPAVEEADIQEVVKQLDKMYKDDNGKSIPSGTELIARLKLSGTEFTITWTSDNKDIKIELVDGLYVVTLPENTAGQSEYKLIATITSAGGQTATVEYNRVLVESFGMITNPVAGTAYKFALLHGNEKAVVFFNGENYNNYAWYLAYTTDQLAAVDVYLETVEGVEGGYRLYFNKDGVKTYIVAFPRDGDTTKGTLKLDTAVPDTYYTYSTEYNTLIYTSVTGQQFYIGSSGTYKSISCSELSYINGATSYPSRLYGAGGVVEQPKEQELPTIPENYTSQDVVDALYKLESGQTIEDCYEITGVITSIKYAYDPSYNNISVNIVVEGRESKPVLAYRLSGGEDLKVGDTITIFAGLTNYNGTYETTSGGVIRNVVPGTGEVPPVGGGDETTTADAVLNLTGNANLVSGSAAQNVFAANGITFTNDKASSSSDLTVQATLSQRAYQSSTVKIEYPGMTKIVITFDDYESNGKTYMAGFDGMTVAGATITRDNDVLTIVFDAATDVFQSGELASQVRIEKIEVYTGEVEGGGSGTVTPPAPTYSAPVAGTAYKFYLEQTTLGTTLYFNGVVNADGRMLTTENIAEAAEIFFETTDGGYHIYILVDGVKNYINTAPYINDKGYIKCRLALDTEPNCTWTYNTKYGIVESYAELDGESDTFFAGTYSNYNTISLSGAYDKDQIASGTQYPARLVLSDGTTPPAGGGEGSGTVTPPAGDENGVFTIPEVLASAEGTSVIVKGTVSGIYQAWDSGYNNMSFYISDDAGNKLLVFRTGTKVRVGDQVTVTGKATLYSGTIQIAQGGVTVIDVAHVCSTFTEGSCTANSYCTVCGDLYEEATGHNYVGGTCSNCGEAEPVGDFLPGNLAFASAENKADADAYMKTNFPEWTITGKLGQTYGGYLGFGRSGDGTSKITSSEFSSSKAFTVTTVLKGNGSSGVATSTLTFTLVDTDGNTIATGYANGSTTAAITPADAKDTTYTISFTFVEGKTWSDATNLVVSFAKSTGNIGLKSLNFNFV